VIYHDVTDARDPLTAQLGQATHPDIFRRHVAFFAKNFDLISTADLLDGRLPRRPLLITFDDAYRSVLDNAVPTLRDAGAPSLFFMIAAVLRGGMVPIDNVLSLAVETFGLRRVLTLIGAEGVPTASFDDLVSSQLPALSIGQIGGLKERLFDALGTTESAVRRASRIFLDAADLPGFADARTEVGNHSMTHAHFRSLSAADLDFEIGQSRAELRRWSGQSVECLGVPYGDQRDVTAAAAAVARDTGHRAIFLVGARSNRYRREGQPYYRIKLLNENPALLPLRLSLLPMLRSFRDAAYGRS
jgi:peptidoglycan/xylan/chitin deacetylase (PgdA/CDA1 family)